MNDFQKGILTLIQYALSPQDTFPSLPGDFDYMRAFWFSEQQQITPLIYYGACKTEDFLKSTAFPIYMSRVCTYISHSARQMEAYHKLATRLEEAGIDYMPFKGTVLKQLYPMPEMRIMGDCDLLVRDKQGKTFQSLMRELGFELKEKGDHHNQYNSADNLVFELHRRLMLKKVRDLYQYYGESWWTAQPSGAHPCHFEMRPEDHYIFIFSHFVKHFRGEGAGIKFLVDMWVSLNAYPDMDMTYICTELEKIGLDEFYHNIQRTLASWFDDAPTDEMTDYLTDRLFGTTVYGSSEKGLLADAYTDALHAEADGSKDVEGSVRRRRFFSLLFLPYDAMVKKYPILRRWAILLPLFWFIRAFDILFHHKDKIKQEKQTMNELNRENIDEFRRELNYVGLDKDLSKMKRPPKS